MIFYEGIIFGLLKKNDTLPVRHLEAHCPRTGPCSVDLDLVVVPAFHGIGPAGLFPPGPNLASGRRLGRRP
jgi:hypothetical protein